MCVQTVGIIFSFYIQITSNHPYFLTLSTRRVRRGRREPKSPKIMVHDEQLPMMTSPCDPVEMQRLNLETAGEVSRIVLFSTIQVKFYSDCWNKSCNYFSQLLFFINCDFIFKGMREHPPIHTSKLGFHIQQLRSDNNSNFTREYEVCPVHYLFIPAESFFCLSLYEFCRI